MYDVIQQYYGQPADDVLVVIADTLTLHPSFNESVIKRMFTSDPVRAMSEYGADGKVEFRQHSSALLDREPLDAVIVGGRYELAPQEDVRYVGFLDAAQGSRSGDSFTLAIAHNEDGRAVLDCVLERKPPFNPLDLLVNEYVPVLERYGITAVVGDNVSSGFVEATLRGCGLRFEASPKSKSDLYLQVLNLINSGAAELLDEPTLRRQFLSLQRFSTGGGKDRIDHPKGKQAHDDVCNAAAGALAFASGVAGKAKKRALFTGHTERDGGRQLTQHEQLARLAKLKIAMLDMQAADDQKLAEKYENMPMTSEAIWRVNGSR
jgi:hypothetical protein